MARAHPFIAGWWHAADTATAAEELAEYVTALGLEPLPIERLAEVLAAIGDQFDEEELRRHQIGLAARHANIQLARLGRPERVRAFGELSDGEDEPDWFVVTPEEHAQLLTERGPPDDPERAYDEVSGPATPWTALENAAPKLPRRIGDLFLFAKTQIREQRYDLAVAALERLLASNYRASDVVLVELAHISALRMAGRHGEAVTAWTQIADRWLAGERDVWRSQWLSLEKLHRELRLPDEDPRVVAVRARQPTAPA